MIVRIILKRLCLLAMALMIPHFAGASEALDAARATVKEWVRTEQAISREAVAWQEKEASLRELIEVARSDIRSLESEIAKLQASATDADERRAELVAEGEALGEKAVVIRDYLAVMENELRSVRPRLPEPLQLKLESFYRRLPADPNQTDLGIAERMQTVVGILSSALKFDDTVTVDASVRTLANGARGEVTKRAMASSAQTAGRGCLNPSFGRRSRKRFRWLKEVRRRRVLSRFRSP